MPVVSISGPPGAGKSTLWHALQAELDARFQFIPDLPRAALETLDPALEAWNDRDFQHYVGYAQALAETGTPQDLVTIADKSLLDAVAYWDVLFGDGPPRWVSALRPNRYAIVFLCDHHGVMPDRQGVQGLHLDARDRLAERIEARATTAAPSVVRLSGRHGERLQRALAELATL